MDGAEPRVFLPDWTLRPGVCLREVLRDRGMTEAGLADRARLGPETVAGLLSGTARFDGVTAILVGEATGTSPGFWLNAQAVYDADLARGARDASGDHEEDTDMSELDATARAAGAEVEATVLLTHGADALLRLAGEEEPVRWPAEEIMNALHVGVTSVLPGTRLLVTVRETAELGRVLSGFRPAEA